MPQQPPAAPPSTAQTPAGEPEAKPEAQPGREKRTPPRRTTTPRPEPAAESPPVTPAPAPAAPQPEVPRIAPILSEPQMKELNLAIDAALTSAEQNLRAVRARERDARQQKILEQAEAFARQARQFRGSDPVSAKTFADKADQLSRELVSTYR